MKYSEYNIYCNYEGYNLLYNSFCDSYLILTNELNRIYNNYAEDINALSIANPVFFETLKSNGFIVEENVDEYKQFLFSRMQRRFSNKTYHIVINPTLDCNLSCWYCYENHISKSKLSDEFIALFKKHIGTKYSSEPFSELIISFFGGEPMLQTKKMIELIEFIKQFTYEKSINLSFSITTNATILNSNLLNILKNHRVSFQITLDGDKEKHDSIRSMKVSKRGTYNLILRNLSKIQNCLTNYNIDLRLNYDNETLKNLNNILSDLTFLDKHHVVFCLHKVWQINQSEIKHNSVLLAIEQIFDKGYLVDFNSFSQREYICYADNSNFLLLNFDGKIFKCTARDFSEKNAVGVLNQNGIIDLDMVKT